MHPLCHKLTDNHASKSKSFLIVLVAIILFASPCFSEEISPLDKWNALYFKGFEFLKDRKFTESKSTLKNSLALAGDDEDLAQKSNEALALAACAEGMAVEKKLQANLDQARNTYLYGIVIVILAAFLLSLVLRYGPEKPKAISRVEDWVLEAKRLNENSPSAQAAALIFSVFIFALVAFGLMVILIVFMWSLTVFSAPEDGHFKEADPYYNEAILYLSRAGRGKENMNKSYVVKYYNRFFKSKKKLKTGLSSPEQLESVGERKETRNQLAK